MDAAVVEESAQPPVTAVGGPRPPDGPPGVDEEIHEPVRQLTGAWRTVAAVAFAAAVAFGLVLRFWTTSAMWLDEALSVNIARLPLSHLHAALRRDGAPPLYYVLLHFWMGPFGSTDVAVRALSGVLSVATLPVAWVAGRRYGGRTVAWVTLLLVATAPFAVFYATEARMYALVMFLTACGFVAVDRALARPRPGNLVAVAVTAGALLYTQYWALYLVAALGLWLAFRAWRATGEGRRTAAWTLAGVAAGCLTFVPWLPTFVYQSAHTGTPWAKPPNFAAIINAITGFTDNQYTSLTAGSNQGRLLALCYFVLGGLALFGLARDRWHIVLDIRTRPLARPTAFVAGGTLALAITGGILTGSAFSPRYAAVVFIPVVLLVALGTLTLVDVRVRMAVLVVAAAAGLAGAVEDVWTQRSQAPAVAAVLSRQARPGDVVAICPDQLGPEVARLTGGQGLRTVTFPRGTGPQFVDWVDYVDAIDRVDPATFARQVEADAAGHRVWLVYMPGYQGFGTKCEQLAADLEAPGWGARTWVDPHPAHYYDPMQLNEYSPPASAG